MDADIIVVIVVATALAFDFTNGFHDTANAVATSISTRAMSPRAAVTMAALLNFVGAFISLEVAACMPRMRAFEDISHYTVEIHRLENDGDRTVREAMASLFDTGIDPMIVIRWKDVYDRLERAIDAAEHVADVLSAIVIKNS